MGTWDDWIGRTEFASDVLTTGLIDRLRATIGSDEAGNVAPPGVHWCLCLPHAPTASLGEDGHPVRGGFVPPIPLSARMWAASKLQFHAPLEAEATIERVSEIAAVSEKAGTSGPLVFVDIDHAIRADGVLAVSERQTIVYRNPGLAPSPPGDSAVDLAGWNVHAEIVPSAQLLFRYSALTFNTHRIHYDAPYATEVEGYAGLVVQGPLTATLLLDLVRRHVGTGQIRSFAFRGMAPAIVGRPLHLVLRNDGAVMTLAARDAGGRPVMTATAEVA